MKKYLLLLALAVSPAMAKSPEKIGEVYAQVIMCKFENLMSDRQVRRANLGITVEYDVLSMGQWKQDRINKGKLAKFEKMKHVPRGIKKITCGILNDKYN